MQYQDENAGTDKQVMKILNPSGDEVSNFILSYNGDQNFDWSKIFSPHHPEQTELMNQLMQIFLSGTLSPEALIESIDLTPDSTKINHYDASNLQDKKSPVDDNGEWTAPQETPQTGEWVAWKDGIITPAFAQWISGRLNQKTYDGTPFILKSSVMVDELDDNGQPIYENDKVKQKN
ncbi:hypothetical protein [Lactococcus fujiensis]|uniref:hypothetical protein n=1 Tax=Lactococcus fujiensis TaxID=610251 RepID=UPI002093D311|nr:hypothetical protein [Lactococcus fujiensis]